MGGVDLSGMLIELYRVPLKSRHWYIFMFVYIYSVSVHCCITASVNKKIKKVLKTFRGQIANLLMTAGKGRLAGHLWTISATQEEESHNTSSSARCSIWWCRSLAGTWTKRMMPLLSNVYSTVKFCKCSMVLCFVPNRNCFKAFHVQA